MAETHERLIARLAAVLSDLHDMEPGAERLCEAGRRMLDADGAALTVMTPSRTLVVLAATDPLASKLEDVQDVVGEGPTKDAYRENLVQLADFSPGHEARWPLMHEHGRRLGFSGRVVTLPLKPYGDPVGALLVYGSGESFWVDPVTAEFLGVAMGAALVQDPRLAPERQAGTEAWSSRAQVHQATGMIISQVGVRPEDAMALLRGQAFANESTLLEVAQEVIERQIDFRHFTIEGD
ncbi:ANTAR domain-containing protein [Aeromicrobium chenweiae]|uniref:Uncharacterized protein n=1 Tax=Aeromicrobium chenweiae TaxID=2079793 RepID=A0A2S0WID0_9ACTN|nr:ANTAR domain-containing protein [Aeromicrobium chenweiae]AWB91101.1 hypothetical protein C3E78_02055 [Aeromicrobium chenweiae]TGN32004.1 ANTAR domain-containing protein [Aeromicrobium chenweiae]